MKTGKSGMMFENRHALKKIASNYRLPSLVKLDFSGSCRNHQIAKNMCQFCGTWILAERQDIL
jgi:hypothetical protein